MEESEVVIRKHKIDGKWVVSVTGITSGFTVHGMSGDDMMIEFRFDASRFNPKIITDR